MTKSVITIGFFSPQQEQENSLFNRLASCWTRNPNHSNRTYSHVELRFSDGAITSITADPGYVHYEQDRLLSNSGYRCFFDLEISRQCEIVMQEYAKKCAKERVPFNRLAIYWNFLPFVRHCYIVQAQDRAYFCSEYIVTLLHKAAQCPELIPSLTSPNDLYNSLKNNPYAEPTYNKTLYARKKVKLLTE